jgi:hypothetical protein
MGRWERRASGQSLHHIKIDINGVLVEHLCVSIYRFSGSNSKYLNICVQKHMFGGSLMGTWLKCRFCLADRISTANLKKNTVYYIFLTCRKGKRRSNNLIVNYVLLFVQPLMRYFSLTQRVFLGLGIAKDWEQFWT